MSKIICPNCNFSIDENFYPRIMCPKCKNMYSNPHKLRIPGVHAPLPQKELPEYDHNSAILKYYLSERRDPGVRNSRAIMFTSTPELDIDIELIKQFEENN